MVSPPRIGNFLINERERYDKEPEMFFTLLGLVAAMLFGVFFGSEGELPAAVQDSAFLGLIVAGALLNGLQILYDRLCRRCHCRFCFGH